MISTKGLEKRIEMLEEKTRPVYDPEPVNEMLRRELRARVPDIQIPPGYGGLLLLLTIEETGPPIDRSLLPPKDSLFWGRSEFSRMFARAIFPWVFEEQGEEETGETA